MIHQWDTLKKNMCNLRLSPRPNKKKLQLLPRKLTWNLKMMVSNRNLLFQGVVFRFHVSFPGCNKNDIISTLGPAISSSSSTSMKLLRYLVEGQRIAVDGCETRGGGFGRWKNWVKLPGWWLRDLTINWKKVFCVNIFAGCQMFCCMFILHKKAHKIESPAMSCLNTGKTRGYWRPYPNDCLPT